MFVKKIILRIKGEILLLKESSYLNKIFPQKRQERSSSPTLDDNFNQESAGTSKKEQQSLEADEISIKSSKKNTSETNARSNPRRLG
jgi:hypothetical protein